MLQARQLGNELFVGVHSDESIALNKGPVVMNLNERVAAVDACKWSTASVAGAPYVTDPKVMDNYGCKYVVHGDDITTDANGNDCYQVVKDNGRFVVVKRTPNISTTDLVGRMLSTDTKHHIPSFEGRKGSERREEKEGKNAGLEELKQANPGHALLSEDSLERFRLYATGADGKQALSGVYVWSPGCSKSATSNSITQLIAPSATVAGKLKNSGKVYYVDGGFDLFFMGHIEFLKKVHEKASAEGGIVVAGIHDDAAVNSTKGESSYPIMNIFERALCVLQCRYVEAVVLGAPLKPTRQFLQTELLPEIRVGKVVHGPTPVETAVKGGVEKHETLKEGEQEDWYKDAKELGMFEEIESHPYQTILSGDIVERVLCHREEYEERQRRKGWKSEKEKVMEEEEKKR